jgi:hypothetical protein
VLPQDEPRGRGGRLYNPFWITIPPQARGPACCRSYCAWICQLTLKPICVNFLRRVACLECTARSRLVGVIWRCEVRRTAAPVGVFAKAAQTGREFCAKEEDE